uniref:Glycosyltransferase family 92 protein n=1 Tax=Haemonchus placei TaxID=6290 RepID=A0A0N4XB03_HAEPC
LLKIYEKEGYLTIQPWLRVTLLTIDERQFNPNINIEFRNQAAAQTDCLLQYKESASFIAFVDLDDVLIPRLAANYLDEFAHLFHSMPNVAYIHYMKENTKLEAGKDPTKFSLKRMLSTIKFQQVSETGKMVANPLYLNHTWIHHPHRIKDGTDRLVSRWRFCYLRMSRKPEVARIFPSLPTNFIYLKTIAQCYEDTYYKFHYSGNVKQLKCPGPDRCFPRRIPCYNSMAKFHSTTGGYYFNFHYATKESFREENGCLP